MMSRPMTPHRQHPPLLHSHGQSDGNGVKAVGRWTPSTIVALALTLVVWVCGGASATGEEAAATGDQDSMVIVRPERMQGPVLNPGKGWVSYGWPGTPPDHVTQPRAGGEKAQAEIDLASVGYRRFEWGLFEPEEGRFDWSILDYFIEQWSSHDKQVAFGVMNGNTHSRIEDGYVTPRWVFEAGVPERTWHMTGSSPAGNAGLKRAPRDWHHPVLMEKIDAFVAALAKRYDGNPAIAFIDIRSHSNWGETMSERHAEIYLRHFKRTRLCASVHMGGAIRQAEWCVERGIAVRRDGIGGSLGRELVPAFNKVPAIFEFWGSLTYLERRGWWKDGALIPEAIEVGRPTYVEIIRNSPRFLQDHRELIDSVTNRIGYHFVLEEARYPATVSLSKAFEMHTSWINQGVAPIFVPCVVRAALVDADGETVIAQSPVDAFNPAAWMPGERSTSAAAITFVGEVPRGEYRLAIGLFRDASDEKPTYVLGSDTAMAGRWHVLGPIHVE